MLTKGAWPDVPALATVGFCQPARWDFSGFFGSRVGKKGLGAGFERGGDFDKLKISNPADLGLNLGQGFAADVPPEEIQFGGEGLLGETFAVANPTNYGTDDIPGWAHCSEFRT